MSSQPGLLGGIGVRPDRIAKAAVFGEVLLVNAACLGNLGLKLLLNDATECDGDGFLGERRQIQARGAGAGYEVGVESYINRTLRSARIIELHAFFSATIRMNPVNSARDQFGKGAATRA
jgi:hypothetical protein